MVSGVRGPGWPRAGGAQFPENVKVASAVTALARLAQSGGASSVMFLPEDGVRFRSWSFPYKSGRAKEMNVPQPPRGPLRGTVVVNVSGHAKAGVIDRATAWAEQRLVSGGKSPTDDARAFVALRAACERATSELLADKGRTKQAATISLPDGQSLELPRALFDKMMKASAQSTDPEGRKLFFDGDQAHRKFFAATNTYQVVVRLPDGRSLEWKDVERNQPGRIEWATRIPIEIPANVRGEVTIECWPSGSLKAGGYIEQRQYKLHLGEGLFDPDDGDLDADAYRAMHRQVRWDTPHEESDLEEHGIGPAPVPREELSG